MQRIVANPTEERAVRAALSATGGNISQAARKLGATRKTVRLRLKTYGLGAGSAGRPRTFLPHSERAQNTTILAVSALALVGVGIAWWWKNRKPKSPPIVAGVGLDDLDAYFRNNATVSGLDALGADW